MSYNIGQEIQLEDQAMMVSATDTRGNILYANDIFCKVSGYSRKKLIGKPHNIIRHEDMPRCMFKYLWDTLLKGESIYAFIKSKTKNGDYYWVKSYMEPVLVNGVIDTIYSYRKPVNTYAKNVLENLYRELVEFEKTNNVDRSLAYFNSHLEDRNLTYQGFIDRLSEGKQVTNASSLRLEFQKYYNDHIIFRANIVHNVDQGNTGLKVTAPTHCNFGLWLKSLEHESFTKHPSWAKLHKAHDHVHLELENYVKIAAKGGSHSELDEILKGVDKDTEAIFTSLQEVIDNYE